jgi:multiple sugar transport system ATP-binding protein
MGHNSALAAEVVVVEPTGAETELLVRAGESQLTLVTHGRLGVQPGERVGLRVSAAGAHLFDRASGRRIAA